MRRRMAQDRSSVGETIEIDTVFKRALGSDCGRFRVTFLRVHNPALPGRLKYVVDNSDLQGLVRLIGSCAAKVN